MAATVEPVASATVILSNVGFSSRKRRSCSVKSELKIFADNPSAF